MLFLRQGLDVTQTVSLPCAASLKRRLLKVSGGKPPLLSAYIEPERCDSVAAANDFVGENAFSYEARPVATLPVLIRRVACRFCAKPS